MDFQAIEAGDTGSRGFTMVAKVNGDPINTGTVNYYLKALSGAHAGNWWRVSDGTWQPGETANPMTFIGTDGGWTITPAFMLLSPFDLGVKFNEYAKEAGNLHVPCGRWLTAAESFETVLNRTTIVLTPDAQDLLSAAIAEQVVAGGNVTIPVSLSAGSPLDLATEPVPTQRTFVLVDTSDGFRSDDIKTLIAGTQPIVYAADFRNHCSQNQKMYLVDSYQFVSGSPSGLLLPPAAQWKRNDGTQARFTIQPIAAGEYIVLVHVNYFNPGTPDAGFLRIRVV